MGLTVWSVGDTVIMPNRQQLPLLDFSTRSQMNSAENPVSVHSDKALIVTVPALKERGEFI